MYLGDQICSLEFAKRLKELGVKQESLFYRFPGERHQYIFCKYYEQYSPHVDLDMNDGFSAFTVAELGEMLPFLIEYNNTKYWYHTGKVNNDNEYYEEHEVMYTNDMKTIAFLRGHTEADARANMLIYLIENKLMELPNET